MIAVQLLDQFDAAAIREVTANRAPHMLSNGNISLPIYVAYTGDGTIKPATKRATCRLCGEKITSGLQLSFYYDAEQNAWTGKEYHVHADGCPTCPGHGSDLVRGQCPDCIVESVDCDASTLDDAGVEDLTFLDKEQYS